MLTVTVLQRELPRDVLSRVFGLLETVPISGALLASLLVASALAALPLSRRPTVRPVYRQAAPYSSALPDAGGREAAEAAETG